MSSCGFLLVLSYLLVFTQGQSHGYILVSNALSWQQANDYCLTTYGSNLASIHSSAQSAEISNVAQGIAEVWIGLHQQKPELLWTWVDHTPANFMDWANDRPLVVEPNAEDCAVVIQPGSYFKDVQCVTQRPFVCNAPSVQTNVPTQSPIQRTPSPSQTPVTSSPTNDSPPPTGGTPSPSHHVITSSPTQSNVTPSRSPSQTVITSSPSQSNVLTPSPSQTVITSSPTQTTPSPSQTVITSSPSQSNVLTPSPSQSNVLTPSPTDVLTSTPTQSNVLTPSPTDNTPSPTHNTPSPTDVLTPTPTQSNVLTPSPTDVHVLTPSPTDVLTSTPTQSNVLTPSPTDMLTPSPTDVLTPTPTSSPSDVLTSSPAHQVVTSHPTQGSVQTSYPTQGSVQTSHPTSVQTSDPTQQVMTSHPTSVQTSYPTQGSVQTSHPTHGLVQTSPPTEQQHTMVPSSAPTPHTWSSCVDEEIEFSDAYVRIHIETDASNRAMKLQLTAPQNIWFGIGFGATVMHQTPVITVATGDSGMTVVRSRLLEEHTSGTVISNVLNDHVLSVIEQAGFRMATIIKPWVMVPTVLDLSDFFDGIVCELPIIWARGASDTIVMGYHGTDNRGAVVLRSCACTEDPTDMPSQAPSQEPSQGVATTEEEDDVLTSEADDVRWWFGTWLFVISSFNFNF